MDDFSFLGRCSLICMERMFVCFLYPSWRQECPQFTLAGRFVLANSNLLQTCCEQGSSTVLEGPGDCKEADAGLCMSCSISRVCRQRYRARRACSVKELRVVRRFPVPAPAAGRRRFSGWLESLLRGWAGTYLGLERLWGKLQQGAESF